MADDPKGMAEHYSEESFWEKVIKYAKIAGREAIEKALTLYFAMQDPQVPAWAKAVCAGALGYFIFPFDAIPDAIVPIGYVDDIGVMAAALTAVAIHVTEETKEKARQKLRDWFGD